MANNILLNEDNTYYNDPMPQSNKKKELSPEVKKIKNLNRIEYRLKALRQVDNISLDEIRSSINKQQQGDFSGVAKIARKMMTDAIYGPAIDKRINGLLRAELSFETADNKDSFQQSLVKAMEMIWFNSIDESDLESLLKSFLNTGVALAYVTWSLNTSTGFWMPKLNVYPVDFLKFNISSNEWYYYGFSNHDPIKVTPGKNNWILLTSWRPGDINGYVSKLAEAWFSKALALQDNINANEKHIDNIAILKKSTDGINSEQDDIDLFAGEVQSNKKNGVIFLPAGYDIEFTDSHGSYKPEAFQWIQEEFKTQIQSAILGGNLATEVNGGSYAAANVHQSAEKHLIASDGQKLSTCLYRQLLSKVVSYNFGYSYVDYTPWPKWNVYDADDLVSFMQMISTAVGIIEKTNYAPTNLPEIMERVGINIVLKKDRQDSTEEKSNGNTKQDEEDRQQAEDSDQTSTQDAPEGSTSAED